MHRHVLAPTNNAITNPIGTAPKTPKKQQFYVIYTQATIILIRAHHIKFVRSRLRVHISHSIPNKGWL